MEDFLLTWSINLPSVQGQPTVPPVEYLSVCIIGFPLSPSQGIAIREQDLRKGKQTPMEVFFYLDSEDLSSSSKVNFWLTSPYLPHRCADSISTTF